MNQAKRAVVALLGMMKSSARTTHCGARTKRCGAAFQAARANSAARMAAPHLIKRALLTALLAGAFFCAALPVSAQESLTPEQAEKLIAGRRGRLPLDQLKSLLPEVAAVLARCEGELLLNGLATLSPEAAAALAHHAPAANFGVADLSLNGLTRIAPETAAALAAHQGAVALKGLQVLDSPPLAQKLARQWGELQLNGLTTLTPEIAAILATNEGVLADRTRPGVIQRRADLAAAVLRFDSLTTLDARTAEALAKPKGVLVLNGLTSLAPETAAALSKHEGTLVLNGLLELPPDIANALAPCPSALVLRAVTQLSPAAATAIVKHQGPLYLTGLISLSAEARAVLREHPEIRLPEGGDDKVTR